MTEEEAYNIVVGSGHPAPYWAMYAMPSDVSYGRRDGEFFVEGYVAPSLGIALAMYTQEQKRQSDFNIQYLLHDTGCGGNFDPNCECRRWAVFYNNEILTRHYDQDSAYYMKDLLDKNRVTP